MITKTMKGLAATLIISLFLSIPFAMAEKMPRQTILFHEGIAPEEIETYISDLEISGFVLLKRVPFINGIVVGVPAAITPLKPGGDARVASIVNDQEMTLQTISAAGDGGAGDGGAGDGGAGDGGAGDGGAGDGGAGDGGAGDGGAGDGGAGDGGANNSNIFNKFINSANSIMADDKGPQRPHGILKLMDHPYDPFEVLSVYDHNFIEEIILAANDQKRLATLKMAVFDTGVDTNHPKLKSRTGKVISGGIDLVNMIDGIPADDNGHGTHVSGTLVGDKFGMVPGIKLHMVKVLDENAAGEVSTLVMALQWCIDKRIDIINMSIAYRENNPVVHMAVRKAHEAGIIMIAAAGNHSNWIEDDITSGDGGAGDGGAGDGGAGDGGAGDGGAGDGGAGDDSTITTNPWAVMYPAAYPEVIAVGAIDAFGDVAPFSNLGPEIDIMAPGTRIYSATIDKGYGIANGTSMACPHIAGAVALMKSMDENNALTPDTVKTIIQETANPDGSLNLYEALHKVLDLQ